MGEVVDLPVVTKLDLSPDRVLAKATERGLESCVVVGYTKEGDEYFASTLADAGEVVWLLERSKHKLMKVVDDLAGDD